MERFNEETIKASHPNQEMFVKVFQHDLKAEQFKKNLVQKSMSNIDEVITRAECYIKGEKSNMEKRSWNAKEKVQTKEEGAMHMKEYFKSGPNDRPIARPSRRLFEKEQK